MVLVLGGGVLVCGLFAELFELLESLHAAISSRVSASGTRRFMFWGLAGEKTQVSSRSRPKGSIEAAIEPFDDSGGLTYEALA